ncbi:hypothetical protein N8D56_23120 [Devosia sp. A8/3-2]|nr:hypothetical protein N8D56_23120 [Devosia sp. A8/3-2]
MRSAEIGYLAHNRGLRTGHRPWGAGIVDIAQAGAQAQFGRPQIRATGREFGGQPSRDLNRRAPWQRLRLGNGIGQAVEQHAESVAQNHAVLLKV